MVTSSISEIFLNKLEGKNVTLRGWIYRHRVGGGGSMVFAVLRDATGIIQSTIKKDDLSDIDSDSQEKNDRTIL